MSAPMVRAILAGSKTQTRRAVKPVGRDGGFVLVEHESGAYWPYRSDDGETTFVTVREHGDECLHEIPMSCPYGAPGDRLWVRESFSGARAYETRGYPLREWGNKIFYWADGQPRSGDWTRPRPSIHMPRCLSRITLEVTGVRVERLQDISEADAVAEGVEAERPDTAVGAYEWLWESINGPGAWDANPWCWVLEFRRLA